MAMKNKTHDIDKASGAQRTPVGHQVAPFADEHERPADPVMPLRRATSAHPSALRPGDILALQRTIGNHAVQRMLSSRAHSLSHPSATAANAIQRQTEEEEPLQGKFQAAPGIENRTGLPDGLKSGIESLSGMSLDNVKVHYNSSRPAQLHALAYAQGSDIHVAPGQEQHLPHEAWHVIQQAQGRVKPTMQLKDGVPVNDDDGLEHEADVMGAKAGQASQRSGSRDRSALPHGGNQDVGGTGVIQGYFEESYFTGSWRQSDDMTVAAEIGYPNHKLYAKAGKVAAANQKLQAVNSGVELVETGTKEKFWQGSRLSKTRETELTKVEAKNKQNGTQGDNMLLWADCGKSNAVVVGSDSRQAVYDKPGGAANTKVPGGPTSMKTAIIKAWLDYEKGLDPLKQYNIVLLEIGARRLEKELTDLSDKYNLATGEKEKKDIKALYTKKLDEVAEAYWHYYNQQTETERDRIDAVLKINRYAKPGVGQGYTISSGGASGGKTTWNFHWGGVVMTSDDNKDTVVLENYAVGDPTVENTKWTFDIYGEKKDQTFHERHQATEQHGVSPTTMVIEKKP